MTSADEPSGAAADPGRSHALPVGEPPGTAARGPGRSSGQPNVGARRAALARVVAGVEKVVGPLRPEPEHLEHRDRLLRVLIPTCGIGAALSALSNLASGHGHAAAALGFASAGSAFAYVLHRGGRGGLASLALVVVMIATQYRLMSVGLGIHDIAIVLYPLILIVAALLFDLRLLMFASLMCIVSAAFAVREGMQGTVPLALAPSLQDLFDLATVVFVTTVALRAITLDFVRVAYRERLQQRELRGLNEALQRYAAGLEASEARWRTLIATAPDRIFSVGEDGRVTFASDDADGTGSLVGRPVGELTEPDRRPPLEAAIRDAFVRQRSARLEVPGWSPSGNPAWWALRVAPVIESGAVRSVTMIATDIWERKQIEAEREALIRELEARNAELEGFTYTVSHDLKSPLITIRAFLGFVEKAAGRGDFEAVRADLARIGEAADRMRRLLDDLLELSRVGRMTNPMEMVPFEAVVREAIANVEGRIAAGRVEVTVAEGLPVVHVDHARIVQVLQNLLENATKFLGEQPAPKIVIGQRGWDADMPVLFVQDNGSGIEPRFREKIFGLFEKLDPSSSGTGVGLALVRRIVEFHGGRVWVESEGRGKGATFCFTLPPREPSGESSGRRRPGSTTHR